MSKKIKVISFDEAIKKCSNPHVLLGNGFSISYDKDIFSYKAIFENASFKGNERLMKIFDMLGTTNFEYVIKLLQDASKIIEFYDKIEEVQKDALVKDVEELKRILIKTISNYHPESPHDIDKKRFENTKAFIDNFKSVYTLNYDLLLYWTIMNSGENRIFDDGFRTPDEGSETYVTWEIEKTNSQNIFYLHGALHLFDAGSTLKKYTWINTGVKLIEQIRGAIGMNYYPIFISEGTSSDKMERINHSNYLSRNYRSFANIRGVLFTYGVSFNDNDDHIFKMIWKSKLKELHVGIWGNIESKKNSFIVNKIDKNLNKGNLKILYYDAQSVKLW